MAIQTNFTTHVSLCPSGRHAHDIEIITQYHYIKHNIAELLPDLAREKK